MIERNERLQVKLTNPEKNYMSMAAESAGMTLQDWCHFILMLAVKNEFKITGRVFELDSVLKKNDNKKKKIGRETTEDFCKRSGIPIEMFK